MRNVLTFYKKIGWKNKNRLTLDSRLFEDNRKYSANYVSNCRKRIQKYIPKKGNHFLDFASGPLQYPEYIKYSKNFKLRHCVDFSNEALKQAKNKIGVKGKYYCGDFFKMNFKQNYFDCILSMHTIYHINKNKQAKAVKKLIKLAKKNKPIIIVYSNPNTLISKLRSIFPLKKKKSILYFYCHQNNWWYQFSKLANVQILPWRSFSAQHQQILFPNNLIGSWFLKILFLFENHFHNFFSKNFQYTMIILKKK
jgi:ubiquinone/menaquinone biosynthesis C-methylase UbiE